MIKFYVFSWKFYVLSKIRYFSKILCYLRYLLLFSSKFDVFFPNSDRCQKIEVEQKKNSEKIQLTFPLTSNKKIWKIMFYP
jgi:hypothetical protein